MLPLPNPSPRFLPSWTPLGRLTLGVGLLGFVGFCLAADAPPKVEKTAKKAVSLVDGPKPLGTGVVLDTQALAQRIDAHIQALLAQDRIAASPISSDAEYCRRVYLDLTGRIPTIDQVNEFLADSRKDKREQLVDKVLASPNHGKHMADLWQALLMPPNSDNRRLDPQPMIDWLEKAFTENKPWDKMVQEILTASGAQDKNGATTYFLANSAIDRLTDSVCKLFMGVQLQCAQCHNHPFNPAWKQDDYWSTAAFFMKVQAQPPRGKDAKIPTVMEKNGARNKKGLPDSAKKLPPKFPAGEKPALTEKDLYRPAFASWLTNEKNPFFAKAAVNRVWAQMFGRGLVHPVDDIHDGNPPSHPGLLEDLAQQFKANKYNLHHLFKSICLSEAYQRTSKPSQGNEKASSHYLARMPVKVMTPEQMYDSLTDLFAANQAKSAKDLTKEEKKANKIQGRPGPAQRNQFIAFFKGEEGADQTEYQAGIPQVLRLMNAPQLNSPAILRYLDPKATPDANIERLYLAILGRKPESTELKRMKEVVVKAGAKPADARQAYADICWVLLNSSEFALNH